MLIQVCEKINWKKFVVYIFLSINLFVFTIISPSEIIFRFIVLDLYVAIKIWPVVKQGRIFVAD